MGDGRFDLLTFGEIMLRLSPPNYEPMTRGDVFDKRAVGSELNVASGVALLGLRTGVISRLPANALGTFIKNRIRFEGAEERIFVISASQKLNSDIAVNFRHYLVDKKIDLLIPFQDAQEEILSLIPEYTEAPSADDQIFFETPFLETQALISETTELTYEKKEQTGVIVIREQGDNRKDRYTSVSYLCYFANKLAQDLSSKNEDYEYSVFVN